MRTSEMGRNENSLLPNAAKIYLEVFMGHNAANTNKTMSKLLHLVINFTEDDCEMLVNALEKACKKNKFAMCHRVSR